MVTGLTSSKILTFYLNLAVYIPYTTTSYFRNFRIFRRNTTKRSDQQEALTASVHLIANVLSIKRFFFLFCFFSCFKEEPCSLRCTICMLLHGLHRDVTLTSKLTSKDKRTKANSCNERKLLRELFLNWTILNIFKVDTVTCCKLRLPALGFSSTHWLQASRLVRWGCWSVSLVYKTVTNTPFKAGT